MATSRPGRLRTATALVPLALLSAAATVGLLGAGSPVTGAGHLPDGTTVPAQAVPAPAGVTGDPSRGLGPGDAAVQQIVATASTAGIPSAALAAYRRAATVIDAADPSCHLGWPLVAAIGRVESDHGRADGNVLDDRGVATPGVYGVPLDGAAGTQDVPDSDAGRFDQDAAHDRSVGPLGFLPSTWSVVGVDADGDGLRNPQDINDAALGAAVFLCSGAADLHTTAGQRAAVYRYHHSSSYVDLVLAIAQAYADGDFTTVPDGTVLAGELTRQPPGASAPPGSPGGSASPDTRPTHPGPTPTTTSGAPTATPTATSRPTPTSTPTSTPTPTSKPTPKPTSKPTPTRTPTPTSQPTVSVSLPPVPTTSTTPVAQALTLAQATARCTLDGLDQLTNPQAFQACVDRYMHPNG